MSKKILLIVEGEKAEYRFFNRVLSLYKLDFEICCFKTNIYTLFVKLQQADFNINLKDLLAEIHPEYKEEVNENFLYTYLIFDLDPHHTKKKDNRNLFEIIMNNIEKVQIMADYFVDETDPTVGKLYVNFPMLESYKDCDSFFDNNYMNESVLIDEIPRFKEYVSKKKIANIRIDNIEKEDFEDLIIQNIFKLNLITNQKWTMPNYSTYLIHSNLSSILLLQKRNVIINNTISVINTSLFLIVDYFGNRNGYYEKLIERALVKV